jgi:uncharacterized protein
MFVLAAEQGYAAAQTNLGVYYQNGEGVPQSYYEDAVLWYRKAAKQGHAAAQNNLAVCYVYGQGVPRDRNDCRSTVGSSNVEIITIYLLKI